MKITPYGIMILIGLLSSLIYIFFLSKMTSKQKDDVLYIYVFACIGALVGSKLLYILINMKQIVSEMQIFSFKEVLMTYLSGGFVFYGGLIGALIFAKLSCNYFGCSIREYSLPLLTCLLLTAGFGRIGCTIAGCCHGIETSSAISIVYKNSEIAPNGVPLIPVQLFEACFDFLLIFIIHILKDSIGNNERFDFYFLSYGIFRFVIEFFRGDIERGFLFGMSTSQWISIAFIIFAIISIIIRKHKA